MMKIFRIICLSLGMSCFSAHFLPVQAFQINRVYHGHVSLDSSALDSDWTLPRPVNPEKSLITITLKVGAADSNEASMLIGAYFVDRSTIRIIREKSGGTIEVLISVAEFKSGVKVTRGVTPFSKNVYQKRIVIPQTQKKSAAIFLQATSPGFNEGEGAHLCFASFFSDSNTLSIKRSEGDEIVADKNAKPGEARVQPVETEESPGKKKDVPRMPMPEATVYWQIIEFMDGVTMTQGSANLPYFAGDTNAYITERIQHPERVFLLTNWSAGQSTKGKKLLTTLKQSMSDSVFVFERPAKGQERLQDLDIQWCLIELQSAASLVQSGIVRFDEKESEKQIPLQRASKERSIVFLAPSGGDLGESMSEAQQSANLKFSGEVIDSETLRISRGPGDSSVMPAQVQWTVVEFAALSLTRPVGAELWFVGDTQKISWDYSEDLTHGGKGPKGVELVDIQLSRNEGADVYPYTLASSVPVTAGSYEWTIPDDIDDDSLIGAHLMVKVSRQLSAERNFDISAKPFEIKGVLKLIAPRGGETWYVGEEGHQIQWEYKGRLGVLGIYYDKESGFGADPFPPTQRIARVIPGKNGRGSFSWSPIPDIASSRVRLKIINESDPAVKTISENDFAVIPKLKIISPAQGADPIDAEKIFTVKWESSGTLEILNLYYRTSESSRWVLAAEKIKGGKPGPWSYRWFVPPEAAGETVQIKLEKAGSPDIFDWSPGNGKGFLTVRSWLELLQPASEAQTWRVGEKHEIQWDMGGMIQYLNFDYSVDDGETWVKEAVVHADDKRFAWTVPNAMSDHVKIRLSDVKNKEIFCESDRNIRIVDANGTAPASEPVNSAWWIKKKI